MSAAAGNRDGAIRHTAGPWVASGPARPTSDAYEGGDCAIVAGGQIVAEAFFRSGPTSTHPVEANARLIAAAPEMLEALVRFRDWCTSANHTPGCSCENCDASTVVINKARGQ